MASPRVFISHRWVSANDYGNLTEKFDKYNFIHHDYSVPKHDPLDVSTVKKIKDALREQIRQCNYFIIFANIGTANSDWCLFELSVAAEYNKPVLSVRPSGYAGNVSKIISNADNQGGPAGFNTPAIIRKICKQLSHPVPIEVALQ